MKLMVDARTFGKNPSGVGIYGYRFVKAILERTDWEVVLLSDVAESAEIRRVSYTDRGFDNSKSCRDPEDSCSKGDSGNVAQLVLYGKEVTKSVGVFGYFRFVQNAINAEKPHVFWEINNLYPVKLKNPYGKIAVTIHDLFPLSMPECFTRSYPFYFRWGMKRTLATADAIIYDAETIRGEMETVYPKAKEKKSFTAYAIASKSSNRGYREEYNGSNITMTGQVAEDGRGAEDPVQFKDYFLYIGNLERRKGTDILLNAYEKYRAAGGDLGLHLVGKIREKDIEIKVDTAINNDSNVRYLGYISDDDKDKELSGCRAFLFPSRAEGFGIPIIEALSYKKPVLAADLLIYEELFHMAITTFELRGSDDEIAGKMAEAMSAVSAPNPRTASETVHKYTEESLTPRLVSFFEELTINTGKYN